jgi:hypothetical protein
MPYRAFMHTRGPTQPVSLRIMIQDTGRAHGKWTHPPASAHTAISQVQAGDCREGPRKVDPCTHVSPHGYLQNPSWRLRGGPTESGPMHPRQPTRLSPKSKLEDAGRAHGKWTHAPTSAHTAISQVQAGDCGEGPRKVDPCTRVSPHGYLQNPSWRLRGGTTESGPMRPRQPTRLSPKSKLEDAGRAHGKWTHVPASAHTAISN